MPKNPILLISKPVGTKGENPVCGFPSRLVDPETRLPILGIADITLQIPVKGVLRCTAEVIIGGVEVVEEDCQFSTVTKVAKNGRVVTADSMSAGKDVVEIEIPNAGS